MDLKKIYFMKNKINLQKQSQRQDWQSCLESSHGQQRWEQPDQLEQEQEQMSGNRE